MTGLRCSVNKIYGARVVILTFFNAIWSSEENTSEFHRVYLGWKSSTSLPGHPSTSHALGVILYIPGNEFSSVENFAGLLTFKYGLIFFSPFHSKSSSCALLVTKSFHSPQVIGRLVPVFTLP